MHNPIGHTAKTPHAGASQPAIAGHNRLPSSETTNVASAAGGQSGEAGSVQQRSSRSQIFASASAQQISGQTHGAGARGPGASGTSTVQIFSAEDMGKLTAAKKIYVAGFSSQGGGHTERMLMPLREAVIADRVAKESAAETLRLLSFEPKREEVVADRPAETGSEAQVRAHAAETLRLLSFTPVGEMPKGDRIAIVLVLPPHWEVDTGNEAGKLQQYKLAYAKENVDVVTVQSDKTILGFYEPHGPSDNFRILEEFASKPNRDKAQTPLFGPEDAANVQKGQGFSHSEIMTQIVAGVGDNTKITVFEDMDPYIAKAADKAGIPKAQIVGQSNHLLLLDADAHFGAKSDAFLVKVNGNGHIGNVATVAFSKEINTTRPLGETLDKFGISPDDRAVDVRRAMVQKILDNGNKYSLSGLAGVPISGTVMVAPDATADKIDRGVYLYLNKYTGPLGEHISNRLNGDGTPEQVNAYKQAMFVVCGRDTFKGGVKDNAMHMAQAANFDAVTAAGFGTSSEMHYLISNNAYQGNLVMMPVEKQHEQEANAAVLMPEALAPEHRSRVSAASDIGDLKAKLDAMVVDNPTTNAKLGQTKMEALYTATHKEEPKATDKAVERLRTHKGMTTAESTLLAENTSRAENAETKALRRLNKVMIPALKALSEGKFNVDIRMTAKDESKILNLRELITALQDPVKAGRLMGADFAGDKANTLREKSVEMLQSLSNTQNDTDRMRAAEKIMRGAYANNTYTLGY